MRPKKVKLRRSRYGDHYPANVLHWTASVPSVSSRFGVLVHRIKSGSTYLHNGKHSHDTAQYWCCNGTTQQIMLSEPPEGRLVCEKCELQAVRAGEPTSAELVGRPVALGLIKAIKTEKGGST